MLTTSSFKRAAVFAISGVATLLASSASAQHGTAPSRTEQFFDDLRAREIEASGSSVGRGQAPGVNPTYTFDGRYYRDLSSDGLRAPVYGEESGVHSPEAQNKLPYSPSQRYGRQLSGYSEPNIYRTSFFAPTYITDPFASPHRNVKLGPISMTFGAGASFEYNDNILRSDSNKLDDFIAGFYVNAAGELPITRSNRITFGFGIGYDYYFNHPEFNDRHRGSNGNLNINPGSQLGFDMKIGEVFVTVYDRFSVRNINEDLFTLDDFDLFDAFFNDFGVAANWSINRSLSLGVNFNREDVIGLSGNASDFAERTNHSVSANLAYSPNLTWTVGIQGSASWADYRHGYQNDGAMYSTGVYFQTPISDHTDIRIGAGLQWSDFDQPDQVWDESQILAYYDRIQGSGTSFGDNNSIGTEAYYNFTVRNQLSSRVSQSFSAGRETTFNYSSNTVTTDYFNYGVGVIAYRGSRIQFSAFVEREDESGGILEEDRDRYGLSVYWGHQLTEKFYMGAGYTWQLVESDIYGRDYDTHGFNADFSYYLTPRTRLTVGYQFTTTDADDSINSYDQNRVLVNLYHSF